MAAVVPRVVAALLAACVAAAAPVTPTNTHTPPPSPSPSISESAAATPAAAAADGGAVSAGAIIGIVIGVAWGALACAFVVLAVRRRRRARQEGTAGGAGGGVPASPDAFELATALTPLPLHVSRVLESQVRVMTGSGGSVSWASEPSSDAARATVPRVYADGGTTLAPADAIQALCDALVTAQAEAATMTPPTHDHAPAMAPPTPVTQRLKTSLGMYSAAAGVRVYMGNNSRASTAGKSGGDSGSSGGSGSGGGTHAPATVAMAATEVHRLVVEALQCAVHVAVIHTLTELEAGSSGRVATAAALNSALRRGCEAIIAAGEGSSVLAVVSAAAGAYLTAASPAGSAWLPAALDAEVLWPVGSDALHTALRYRHAAAVRRATTAGIGAGGTAPGVHNVSWFDLRRTRASGPTDATGVADAFNTPARRGLWFTASRRKRATAPSAPRSNPFATMGGSTMSLVNPLRQSLAAPNMPRMLADTKPAAATSADTPAPVPDASSTVASVVPLAAVVTTASVSSEAGDPAPMAPHA